MVHKYEMDRKIAYIHQPYFLPWLGFFHSLYFADVYIALDDVHFRKRHYIDRTRIIDMHGYSHWLSLPTGQHLAEKINSVVVPYNQGYSSNLVKTIEHSYARAKYFDAEWRYIKPMLLSYFSKNTTINHKNIYLIERILNHLNISLPEIKTSSSLGISSTDRTERIIEILQATNCNTILIGAGASYKIHDWTKVMEHSIDIVLVDYLAEHPQYYQYRRRRSGFVAGLSILDALLNQGRKKTREFVSLNVRWQRIVD